MHGIQPGEQWGKVGATLERGKVNLCSMAGNGKRLFDGDGRVAQECKKQSRKMARDEGVGGRGAWPIDGIGDVGLDNQVCGYVGE